MFKLISNYIVGKIRSKGFEITKTGVTDRGAVTYKRILSKFNIQHIIDAGANEGQFALGMRKLGYSEYISSFEPLSKVFLKLTENSAGDNKWNVYNLGFGNSDEILEINVSANTVSSSLLEMLPEHIKQEPSSKFISKEEIYVKRIDTIWGEFPFESSNVFLKLDVQGYEKFALEGAVESLKHIKLIQLEMALMPLYKGELILADMVRYMDNMGYKLYNLMNGFNNFETGQLFQVDGIFARADLIN